MYTALRLDEVATKAIYFAQDGVAEMEVDGEPEEKINELRNLIMKIVHLRLDLRCTILNKEKRQTVCSHLVKLLVENDLLDFGWKDDLSFFTHISEFAWHEVRRLSHVMEKFCEKAWLEDYKDVLYHVSQYKTYFEAHVAYLNLITFYERKLVQWEEMEEGGYFDDLMPQEEINWYFKQVRSLVYYKDEFGMEG
jgi:hypothetical protein